MSLEKLLQTINDKEEILIKQIEEETKKEIDAIVKNFDAEIEAHSNTEWQKAKESINLLQQREDVNLDIYRRKIILELKRNILENVYAEFIEKVKNLGLAEYKIWLFKNLDSFDFLTKKGELFIGIGNFVGNMTDEFSQDIISYLKSKNLASFKTTFTNEIDFGFKYVEGAVSIDCSLDAIISEIKQNSELKISKILFS